MISGIVSVSTVFPVPGGPNNTRPLENGIGFPLGSSANCSKYPFN